jgi:hypothetical protein
MALTAYQIAVLNHLSARRKRDGVSFVAGGAALNVLLREPRRSRDIDMFHDTAEALRLSWESDKASLCEAGYVVDVMHEAPTYVEAVVRRADDRVLIQWVRDSAFRFFPVVEDETLGLTLHRFDLATNKILATAGRLEPRDWVDAVACHRKVQPLGYLIWAACGKDPGMNPDMLLSQCAQVHYSQEELDSLDFEQTAPRAADVSREWKHAVADGEAIVAALPEDHLGECVLRADGTTLYSGSADELRKDVSENGIRFHKGTLGGVWPTVVEG